MDATRNSFVVGVDASPESNEALDWTRAVAQTGDTIVVVHAWEVPLVTGYDMVVTIDPSEIERLSLQGLTEMLGKIDDDRLVPVTHQGHAGRALVSKADDHDAAAIVVGRHGNSRVAMMLGSTANYVLHHTRRPVVIVCGDHAGMPRQASSWGSTTMISMPSRVPRTNRLVPFGGLTACQGSRRFAWCTPGSCRRSRWACFPTVAAEIDTMDAAAQQVVDHVLESAGPAPSTSR